MRVRVHVENRERKGDHITIRNLPVVLACTRLCSRKELRLRPIKSKLMVSETRQIRQTPLQHSGFTSKARIIHTYGKEEKASERRLQRERRVKKGETCEEGRDV